MTDDQKYSELLRELGRIIKEKNDEIIVKGFQNANLQRELEKAEKEINEMRKVKNEVHNNN